MTTSTAAGNAARTPVRPDSLLRLALRLDAVVTGLNGAAYLAAAPLLDDVLGLSGGLLRGVGVFLLVYAVAVRLVGSGPRISGIAVEAVIGAPYHRRCRLAGPPGRRWSPASPPCKSPASAGVDERPLEEKR